MNRREFLAASGALTLIPTAGCAAPAIGLQAAPVTARILPEGDSLTRMLGFNGSTPGPELRARQGDRVSVSFENGSGQRSAIHWHGIHLDNAMDGVPGLTQAAVEPGGSFDYAFDVPHAGTYWYHAHHRSWEQVARGLYGPLIVEEPDPPTVDHDITVVLDDWRLERGGELQESFGNRHDFSHAGRTGNVARALFSRDTVRRGDRIRLRLINAATARTFPVSIGGGTGKVVARDGMPLAAPAPLQDLLLAPAQRTDVILDVAGPVSFALQTGQGPHDLGTIAVRGSSPAPTDAPIRPLPPASVPAPDRNGATRLTLVMQGGAMGGRTQAATSGPSMTGRAFRNGRGAGSRAARRLGSPCATTPPSRTASTCTATISTSSGKTAPSATTGTRPWLTRSRAATSSACSTIPANGFCTATPSGTRPRA